MRGVLTALLASGIAWGQAAESAKPVSPPSQAAATAQADAAAQAKDVTTTATGAATAEAPDPNAAIIPAGTKIPLVLKQAISTKNAKEGDAVYAETAFPFVVNDRILVPAGTYIQGKITQVQHPGRMKGRASILLHFTSMIYPSGYTVMLPGSVENTPGADDKSVKDKEGTIQADKDTGKRIEDAAKGGAVGGTVGTIGGLAAGGLNGALYGGLAGMAGGAAWALLKHGPDVRLDIGTSLEMEIQRSIAVDSSRIQVARAAQ